MTSQSSELDPPKKDASYLVHRILKQQSIDRPVAATDDLREVGLSSLDMVELVLSVAGKFPFNRFNQYSDQLTAHLTEALACAVRLGHRTQLL